MTEQMKEEILNMFCEPGIWDGIRIECIALRYKLDAATVNEIVNGEEAIDLWNTKRWRFVFRLMKEVFSDDEIAEKFGITRQRLYQIMKEEGL